MMFSSAGTVYYYEEKGSNTETVVLLHGFTSTGRSWRHTVAALSTRYRTVVIDMPGHGKTEMQQPVTMQQFADDLHALLLSIGAQKCHLIGYSMGGRAALYYAVRYPETLMSLILESASPGIASETERIKRKERDEQLAKRILDHPIESFVDEWEQLPLFESQKQLPEGTRQAIRDERLGQRRCGLAYSLRGMGTGAQPPLWSDLQRLKMPILLLTGGLDTKFISIGEKMDQALPNSELKIFFGTGHAIHVEKCKEFDTVVMEFLTAYT